MADLEFRIGAKVGELQTDLQAGLAAVQDFGRKAQAELEKAGKPRNTPGRFLPAGTQEEVAGLGREFERTGRTAAGAGAKMGGAFDQAAKGARATSDQLQSIQTRLVQIASAAALAGLVRGATNTAIAFEGFEIALRTITGSAEQAASELAFVRAESDRLGIGLRGATEQFVQLVAAANGTTLAGEGIRQVFTAVAEAGVVLRLDNEKLAGAFNAIQQIISKGTVSAEELRGQLGERLPGAFQIAARSLGITTEELQKLLEDGLLPATEFLPRFAAQLRRELGGGVVEASRGARAEIERFKTALTDLQLAFASTGFLEAVAASFRDIAGALRDPELRAGIKELGLFIGSSLQFVVANADKIALAFGALAGASAGARLGRLAGPTGALVGAGAGALTGGAVGLSVLPGRSGEDPNAASVEEARQRLPIVQQRVAKLQAELKTVRAGLRESVQLELEQVTESAAALQRVIDVAARAAEAPTEARPDAAPASRFVPKAKGETEAARAAAAKRAAAEAKAAADEAERLRQAQLDADEKLLDDAAKRELAIQEAKFEAALISAEAYYTERNRIELQSVERSIAIERSRAQGGGVDAIKALAEIELLERRRSDIQRRGAEERAAFTRDLDRQLERARLAELEATNRPVEAARLKAESQYRDLLARLRAEGDTAGIALIERLIGAEVADAGIKALQERVSAALQSLRGQEGVIAAQADAGLLPQLEAERQLQVLREASLVQLRAYREELVAIAAAQNLEGGLADPRVAQQITQLDTEIARVTASQRRLQTQIENAGANALTGFFTDLATGAKSFGDAVRDAARNFIASLARMAAEALAKRAILALIGGPAAAGAGGGSEGGLISALFKHSGGMVGASGGTTRMMNPLLFVGAPRYHAGGMVGLKADERPAILQTGEQVLSRQEVAAQNRGGGAQSLRIINSIDPGLVADYMASAEGERVIVNTLSRNRGQVKQLLG